MSRSRNTTKEAKVINRDNRMIKLCASMSSPDEPDPITDGWDGEEPFDQEYHLAKDAPSDCWE